MCRSYVCDLSVYMHAGVHFVYSVCMCPRFLSVYQIDVGVIFYTQVLHFNTSPPPPPLPPPAAAATAATPPPSRTQRQRMQGQAAKSRGEE